MLTIQHTKLMFTREAGGRIPPYEKGVAKRFWGVENDRGFSRKSGGKRYGKTALKYHRGQFDPYYGFKPLFHGKCVKFPIDRGSLV